MIQNVIRTGEADFEAVAQAIKATDAPDYTRQGALKEAELACQVLSVFPDSPYQTSLLEF